MGGVELHHTDILVCSGGLLGASHCKQGPCVVPRHACHKHPRINFHWVCEKGGEGGRGREGGGEGEEEKEEGRERRGRREGEEGKERGRGGEGERERRGRRGGEGIATYMYVKEDPVHYLVQDIARPP